VKGSRDSALGIDLDDRCANGDRVSLAGEERNDCSRERAGELDERLRCFDFDEDVVNSDGVAHGDAPLDDFGFG
jgi:hypothetical protein